MCQAPAYTWLPAWLRPSLKNRVYLEQTPAKLKYNIRVDGLFHLKYLFNKKLFTNVLESRELAGFPEKNVSWVVGASHVHASDREDRCAWGWNPWCTGSVLLMGLACFPQPGQARWGGSRQLWNLSSLTQGKLFFIPIKSDVNVTGWATQQLLSHEFRVSAPGIVCGSDISESFAPGMEIAKQGTMEDLAGHFRGQALKWHTYLWVWVSTNSLCHTQ